MEVTKWSDGPYTRTECAYVHDTLDTRVQPRDQQVSGSGHIHLFQTASRLLRAAAREVDDHITFEGCASQGVRTRHVALDPVDSRRTGSARALSPPPHGPYPMTTRSEPGKQMTGDETGRAGNQHPARWCHRRVDRIQLLALGYAPEPTAVTGIGLR